MDEKMGSDFKQGAAIFGALVVVAFVLGGWLLGAQIKAIKLADRYVSVKGLVERTVKSDLAIWTLNFKEAGNDLPSVYAKSESDRETVMKFLEAKGIAASMIETGQIRVADLKANEWGNSNNATNRYIVEQTITVRSEDVDKVAAAGQKTSDLVQQGVVLSNTGGIAYKFNGLNAIKPDMITEATKNARAAADRFAADSGSKVGSIRQANQGVFSIDAADSIAANPGEGGGYQPNNDNSIMKKVRVVSTIDYYLEK